jgi:hypothetical protein
MSLSPAQPGPAESYTCDPLIIIYFFLERETPVSKRQLWKEMYESNQFLIYRGTKKNKIITIHKHIYIYIYIYIYI